MLQLSEIRLLLLRTIQVLVDDADAVNVEQASADGKTIFRLTVSPADIKRLIGIRGHIANSLRHLFQCIGNASQISIDLKIVEK